MEATGATQLAWVSVAMSRVTRAVREVKRENGDKNALELVKTVSLTPANGKALIVAALATHQNPDIHLLGYLAVSMHEAEEEESHRKRIRSTENCQESKVLHFFSCHSRRSSFFLVGLSAPYSFPATYSWLVGE